MQWLLSDEIENINVKNSGKNVICTPLVNFSPFILIKKNKVKNKTWPVDAYVSHICQKSAVK